MSLHAEEWTVVRLFVSLNKGRVEGHYNLFRVTIKNRTTIQVLWFDKTLKRNILVKKKTFLNDFWKVLKCCLFLIET
jgi:hypothetical protein